MTFENIEVSHLKHALRGMRNPKNSWDKSDTIEYAYDSQDANNECVEVGPNDRDLAHRLIYAGQPHRKFMRQISVIVDICKAPSYFWIELDTYKVGTVKDSSSTMHRIMSRPLTKDDFEEPETELETVQLGDTIQALNITRENYHLAKSEHLDEEAEQHFRAMKRMLPHSYLYERVTWSCSYENLIEIWRWRHTHRLPIWHEFCENFIKKLPYSEFITECPYKMEEKQT